MRRRVQDTVKKTRGAVEERRVESTGTVSDLGSVPHCEPGHQITATPPPSRPLEARTPPH